jgi:uncharacterized protein YeaO (DUF488 family)
VRIGRVYDARGSHDEVRVLVDRLWPRGLSKARADLDHWCKWVAPSTALRTWYGHDPDRFVEFERRYRRELDEPQQAEELGRLREWARRGPLILLTATYHLEISEAAVLASILNAHNPHAHNPNVLNAAGQPDAPQASAAQHRPGRATSTTPQTHHR